MNETEQVETNLRRGRAHSLHNPLVLSTLSCRIEFVEGQPLGVGVRRFRRGLVSHLFVKLRTDSGGVTHARLTHLLRCELP